MKKLILIAFAAATANTFASTLECHNSFNDGDTVTLTAQQSENGVNYTKVQMTKVISKQTDVKKFASADYDPTYKSKSPKAPDRTAFRIMKSKRVFTNYTFFRPKEVGNKFRASLAEANAGYHGETEYTALTCTQE